MINKISPHLGVLSESYGCWIKLEALSFHLSVKGSMDQNLAWFVKFRLLKGGPDPEHSDAFTSTHLATQDSKVVPLGYHQGNPVFMDLLVFVWS